MNSKPTTSTGKTVSTPARTRSSKQKPRKRGAKFFPSNNAVRYLLERRLGRAVEALTRDAIAQSLPAHVIQNGAEGELVFAPSRRDNPFCKCVYATVEGRTRCNACYLARLEEAQGKQDILRYTCHAGLTNVLIPVTINGSAVAGLIVGRVFTQPPTDKQKKTMAARLSGCVENPTAVGELLEKVPVVDGPNLEFAALVARNLVQNEGPTILEPELSNSNTSRSENLQPCSPAATTGALVGTYGKYLHHQRICRKVVEMMEQQFASPITVGRLANAFNISPNYLALLFRKTMGMTITDHLTRTRIQKAQQLLQRTDVNVKEAAFRVGFSDANYFTSVFRKATGLTPSQWRARCDEELLQARPINPHFKPTQPAK